MTLTNPPDMSKKRGTKKKKNKNKNKNKSKWQKGKNDSVQARRGPSPSDAL